MKRGNTTRFATGIAAVLMAAAGAFATSTALAKDYILTTVKPNTLVLADAAARKVVKAHTIPGAGSPLSVVPSPDGRIAYVLTNQLESLVGLDIDSGRTVFRADFSTKEMRVKGMFAVDISPDGKELFVMQSPVKLKPGEYEVQDTRIAVYRTDAGLEAQPVRTFPVPRRTVQMFMGKGGDKLYAVSWDIHVLDPRDGRQLDVLKVANWERPNYAPPDVFGVWNQYEQTDIYVNPYFTLRTDMSMEDPNAWKTGMMTLDLTTGEFQMDDFESTAAIMFSSVINPKNHNEAYSVYTQLTKTDLAKDELVKRVDLDHTYYTINISADGEEVYLGGTMDDIAVYSTETLEKVGEIRMPGGADMATTWVRMVQR